MRGLPRRPRLRAMRMPLVTVFGATGALGSCIVRALLAPARRRFRVRAVTRRPGSGVAQALAAQGAELMVADLDDPASLRRALHGAQGAFCRTLPGVRETLQAAALHDAIRAEGVAHVVWWLPAPPGATDGLPVTPLAIGFAWDALLHPRLHPRRDARGRLVMRWPLGAARLAGIAGDDAGACVAALFERGPATHAPIAIAAERLGGPALATRLSRALAEPVLLRFEPPPGLPPGWPEALRHAQAADVPRAVAHARHLHPPVQDFTTWLIRHTPLWRTTVGPPA